jgi:hypothetical protein
MCELATLGMGRHHSLMLMCRKMKILRCTIDLDCNAVKISVHVPVYVYPYQPCR